MILNEVSLFRLTAFFFFFFFLSKGGAVVLGFQIKFTASLHSIPLLRLIFCESVFVIQEEEEEEEEEA